MVELCSPPIIALFWKANPDTNANIERRAVPRTECEMTEASFSDLHHTLARQIYDLIRSEKLVPGAHLAVQPLADRLQVSRTPVMQALRLLSEQGFVTAEPKRGFFAAHEPQDSDRQVDADLISDHDSLYLAIGNDRIDGVLASTVTEVELMRRYNVGRRQLSRVLQRMAGEGVVKRRPGRGWVFASVIRTKSDCDQSYRFRLMLEPLAFDEPNYKPDPQELSHLRQEQETILAGSLKTDKLIEFFEMHTRFHETLVKWSGNRFLLSALRQHNRLRRFAEHRGFVDPSHLQNAAQQHLEILAAIERGSLRKAQELMVAHLRGSQQDRSTFATKQGA